MERHFIDICEEKEICGDLRLKVHLDPVRNLIQERSFEFPWIYRIRSSVLYLEDLEPEQRILNAYLKSERASKDTVLFHPYKKPYTSCILRKFLLEDPCDPKRAALKYCREKPIKFVIFSKPGLNVESLAIKISTFWGCVHISPQTAINTIRTTDIVEKTKASLQMGHVVGVTDIMIHIKEKLESAESRRSGYVLTGLPMRHHMDSDFQILEQMEMIFETENRPDIIIYVTSPPLDVRNMNDNGFIHDIKSGFYFNKIFIKDGITLQENYELKLNDLEKSPVHNYNNLLFKQLTEYQAVEAHGLPVDIGKLPSYSEKLVEDYVTKILPIIDSYILEYDTQCIIKLDGRIPVTNMFEIVKTKLVTLPYLPICKAKPIFDEMIETMIETDLWDERSEDSIKEESPELLLQEDDEEEFELGEGGEEAEEEEMENYEKQLENEEAQDETTTEDEKNSAKKINKELQHLSNMVPQEALRRLKDYNKVDPNFKWSESDYGAYCPIEFNRGNICQGLPKYTCTYLGKLYMMSTLEAMQEFLSDPNRYTIPPKPFPTFKIFVVGPPWSGKSSVVEALSGFFDLKVISTKKLIEEISGENFFDMEIRELVRKQKKLGKVQALEDTIFNSYEKRRCTDIMNWIKEQLPYIYQRIKFTSLIYVSSDEKLSDDQKTMKEEIEDEISEEEEVLEEFIFPIQENFLETINRLTRPDLKTIIALKKFTLDLPIKSDFEKIYENIDINQHPMLLKAIPYEEANVRLDLLQGEFKDRGLDFHLNTEDYIDIFLNPARLLLYLPNRYRKPYYNETRVHYEDERVNDLKTHKIGIRSEFGLISVETDALIDKFENAILDIEAENNLQLKGDDLQIGGWIIDDVPLDKIFWNLLAERYLLPDDIVIRMVPPYSYEKVKENFCAVTGIEGSNDVDKQNAVQDAITLTRSGSDECLKDVETDRFLDVRNSFLQVNKHYKIALEGPNIEENTRKTCKDKPYSIVTQEVLEQLPKPNKIEDVKVKYIYSTLKPAGLHIAKNVFQEMFHDPFDPKILPIKRFHLNFWTDDEFLVEIYREITNPRVNSEQSHSSISVKTLYVAENQDKSSAIDLSMNITKPINQKLIKDYIMPSSCSSESSDLSTSIQSISSSDTTNRMVIANTESEKKGIFNDKTRLSLLKKQKMKQGKITEYAAGAASRQYITYPEDLFELHGKIILDKPKSKLKVHDLFEIFYREIESYISPDPKTFELKYLTEIKSMFENGADLMEVATAMMKYLRKVKKSDDSKDNVLLAKPSCDIVSDKNNILRKISGQIRIISEPNMRGRLHRTQSKTQFPQSEMQFPQSQSEISMLKLIHKDLALSRISDISIVDTMVDQYLKDEERNPIESNILCYKDSDDDIYKSSSILLNIETIPSVISEHKIPDKDKDKMLRLPKIDNSDPKQSRHDCSCLQLECESDICSSTSSSSTSEIEAERKKKMLCIWDDPSLTIFPKIPREEQIQYLKVEEDIDPPRRDRQMIKMKTLEMVDKEQKEIVQDTEEPNEDSYEDLEFTENEEEESKPIRFLKKPTVKDKSSIQDIKKDTINNIEMLKDDDRKYFSNINKQKESLSSLLHERKMEGGSITKQQPTLKTSTTSILRTTPRRSSVVSVLNKSSTENIVKQLKVQKNLKENESKNEDDESSISYKSEIEYQSQDTLNMTLYNIEGYDSNTLLPGIDSNEWETFIEFINTLYLSITTYSDLGFKAETQERFYLECCPSSSDTSLKDYRERPTSMSRKSRNLKAEAARSSSKIDSIINDDLEDEGICLLEVALPLGETQMNTALTTTLKCLLLGKTISELFSANKHNKVGQQLLTTSDLNLMYKDDMVKELKKASGSFDFDRRSEVMPIDDVSSGDAIFNSRDELVLDNRYIELYDGNLIRYRSLDQRFRPSVEILSDTESDDEPGDCPEIFLNTVPRAILYIPYIVPRFRPIKKNKRITSEHLRRYYSLQSMCRLVEEEGEEEEETLKFKYILEEKYSKKFKSIYIHRPAPLVNEWKKTMLDNREDEGEEEELDNVEDEEIDNREDVELDNREDVELDNRKDVELDNREEEGDKEEDEESLKLIQDIIEPLIDVFRKEIIKAEMQEQIEKSSIQDEIRADSVRLEEASDSIGSLNMLEDTVSKSHLKATETNENDEIEDEITKRLTFSYPYNITKLMFQKYDFITIQTSEDDTDEILNMELNNIKTPIHFQRFMDTFDYNVRIWLSEWDSFKKNVLTNVQCNLIDVAFVPFEKQFQLHMSNSIAKLLHNYEPQADYSESQEKLIKTINLEEKDIEIDELDDLTETDATEKTKLAERDIGDVELHELLPDGNSDFYPYCPLSYRNTNELVPVNDSFKAKYREKYFSFSAEEDMKEFIKWPEHYSVLKEYEYDTTPIRICVVAPRDLDETYHISRSLADYMALPLKTLTAEIKRIQGRTLNIPVGIFDEEQSNIKMFGLDETNEDPQQNSLENTEWDHIRDYLNLKAPLTDKELDALIDPLWKANYGHVLHGFPHLFEDFQYMVRMKTIPDAIVFIDIDDERKIRSKEIEDRIKARQMLNFGARLKRLLAADHIRYTVWKEAYPKLFNIVLRKFLRERRAERNFRERLNLVLPTLMKSQTSLEEFEEMDETEDMRPWDVEWLLYQVEGQSKGPQDSTAIQPTRGSALELKRLKKYVNVLDDPSINQEEKLKFLEQLERQKATVELFDDVPLNQELLEDQEGEGESIDNLVKERVNLSDIDFPDVKSIFEPSVTNISEEESLSEENKTLSEPQQYNSKTSNDLITDSEEQMNAGIKIQDRRQVAVTDMFDPPFQKKYLPKFRQVVYKSKRPFNEEDYRKNVTEASSTSLLGHHETDSIELRELTSSLSLLDVESRNKQFRLMQLVLGNKIALKDHFMNIVNQFKESHPIPISNARKVKMLSFKNLTKELKKYYNTEKEHVKRIKDLCEMHNIPYVIHNSRTHIKNLAQNIRNITRKPHAFEKVYIINHKTASKLLENGLYFLSRFGYWCPVQLHEHDHPFQFHYSDNIRENIIIPILHRNYIYFINGRKSAIKFAQSPLTYIKQHDVLSFFPVKVAIIGLQKSKKTSLSKNLANQHGLQYISVDLAISYVLEKLYWSDLAKNINSELQKGDVLSHVHKIKCIESFINSFSKSLNYGWVLDGFPNTVDELILMRENDIVPNIVFGVEPPEDCIKDIFCSLDKDRIAILNDYYGKNEFIDLENDEKEDDYYDTKPNSIVPIVSEGEITGIEKNEKYEYTEEEEAVTILPEEPPESIYIRRIKMLLSTKQSIPIEPVHIQDFDKKLIDFELNNLPPPVQVIEMKMLRWLETVKTYDRVMNTAGKWWGNTYKLEWTQDTMKLSERITEIVTAFVWALQNYNLKISKGLPASLYLTGITEEEYQLHKSPFNDCCPGCWYYHHIYFRCPTCLFKDMMPGMIQYENYFYWLCIQHYDMFLSNPVKFLMSYETEYGENYPEKSVIGESFLQNNLKVHYNGLCITCYYKHLPNLKHVKGYGKYSVIINKIDIYLFCSNKCVCEMLMRPTRYLNLEIEYTNETKLPPLRNISNENERYKLIFEQLVSDAIYDCVRKFLYLRPKLYKLSHKTSACTYLALHLKLKAKKIPRREIMYYKNMLEYMEKHCREVETICRNIDQIFAFHGPLSVIEHTKARCLPPDIQDKLLNSYLPQQRSKQTKNTTTKIKKKQKSK